MSRTDYLTTAILILFIAAFGYLVFRVFFNNKTPTTQPQYTEREESTSIEELYPIDSSLTDEDGYYYDQDQQGYDDASSNDDVYVPTEEDNTTYSPQEEDNTSYINNNTTTNYSSQGDFMVLAGSFKQKVNAETQVSKLKKLGYSNASVELFNRGAYAVALVDRYDTMADAEALKNELISRHSIEAKVLKKRVQKN
ncbi:MAG: SPOR domain-containing protein [Bacteroidota bacterium]